MTNSNKIMLLKSEKAKYFKSLFSSLVFTAFGIKLIHWASLPFAGWIITIFFGFAAVASIIPLLPNQSYLKLDKYGFTIRSMFKTISIKWHEVEGFETAKKNLRDMVVYKFINKGVENRNYVNLENLLGKSEVLPDVYGMKASELAELLEYYRIRGSVYAEAV